MKKFFLSLAVILGIGAALLPVLSVITLMSQIFWT